MRRSTGLWGVIVLAGMLACGGEESELPASVRTAVDVAQGVAQRPTMADSVLAAHGLTIAQFDSLMFEIALNEEWRMAFDQAMAR